MRDLIAETVLTDGPIRWHHEHRHSLDDVADYVVVATRRTGEAIYRRDLAIVEDAGQAVEIAHAKRTRVDISDGYAIVESVFTCGCRSDALLYQQSRRTEENTHEQ